MIEHAQALSKLAFLVITGIIGNSIWPVDLDSLTTVLTFGLTLGAGYILMFADSRYVRKSYFSLLKDRFEIIENDIKLSQERLKAQDLLTKERHETNREMILRLENRIERIKKQID